VALKKALAKEPDARFQTAGEFDQVLAEIALQLDMSDAVSGVMRTPGAMGSFSTVRRRPGSTTRLRGPVLLFVFVALATAIAVVLLGLRGG
jgi:hypothetical protein